MPVVCVHRRNLAGPLLEDVKHLQPKKREGFKYGKDGSAPDNH